MNVINFWTEEGVIWDGKQQEQLDAELLNLASLVDIEKIVWQNK